MSHAIVGTGIAGLACARRLADHGISPVLFDKGRGVGGRLATRRAEGGLQFDHGAQYLAARGAGFAALLSSAQAAGALAPWPEAKEGALVGVPGMTGLAKLLAHGLEIRQGLRITRIARDGGRWKLAWDGGAQSFDRVISTVPAPQAAALFEAGEPFGAALGAAEMEPCLTLMFALPRGARPAQATFTDPGGDIAWLARDGSKPQRPDADCYVAQAGPAWSRAHLELEPAEIARRMVPLACAVIGARAQDLRFATAHRWRYARAVRPLGRPFLSDPEGTLFAGGDWCLGTRAEDAWSSGTAIADAIIAREIAAR